MKIGIGYKIPNAKGGHSAPNPGFEYNPIAWCEDDGPNTPTVTGDPGGVFSVSPSITGFNTTTGAIPANTAAGSYAVTYAVNGVSETDTITISPDVSTTFTYPNAENRFTIFPTQATTTAGVYSFTVNPGNITFANGATTSATGSIDTTGAALGAYTVQFQPNSTCGNPTTSSFNIIQAFESFEFTVQMAQGETFTIPTTGSGYSYRVNWGLNSNNNLTNFVGQGNLPSGNNYTGNATSPPYNAGTYTIQIGDYGNTFPRIYFNNTGDKAKMRNITSWGEIPWTSFDKAFYGCADLGLTATNSPNLSNCSSLMSAFQSTTNFVGAPSMNNWDISNVTTLRKCFQSSSSFNTDISNWDTSSVTSMSEMFRSASSFNQPINTNYLTNAQSPTGTAYTAWDVSSVTSFTHFLDSASSFNQDIGSFKLKSSGTISMGKMFQYASNFNQDINTKSVTVGPNTYAAWDTSQVTNFNAMFQSNSGFDSSIGKWNTSSVTDMSYMFYSASNFNKDINTKYYDAASSPTGSAYTAWDVSSVTSMGQMLRASKFNQSIDKWQFNSSLTSFSQFMRGASDFNQPINTQTVTVGPNTYTAWDVQNIQSFAYMFYGCADFNQPLNNWNTGSATSMSTMFFQCSSFDQSLADWDISSVSTFGSQFGYSLNLSTTNYDATLVSWNNQSVQTLTQNVDFGESVPSCDNAASNGAFAARANLMTSNKWNVPIVDRFSTNNRCQPLAGFDYTSNAYCANGSDVTPTVTGTIDQTLPLGGTISDAWSAATYINPLKIRLTGIAGQTITVPTYNSSSANYTIVWGDGQESYGSGGTNIFNFRSHTYDSSRNTAVLEIGKPGDQVQPLNLSYRSTFSPYITEVIQWGNTKWETLKLDRAANLTTIPATEVPLVANNVTNAWDSFFSGCSSFTGTGVTWSNWNTVLAKITSLTSWFKDATSFNGDISGFNTSTITSFSNTFNEADAFNIDISSWDVSNGTTYAGMFLGAGGFAKSLENWVLGSNAAAGQMFRYAGAFGQTNTFNMDTLVGWGVYAYNNNDAPSGITLSQFSGNFNGMTWIGTQTTNSSGVAYSTQYGAQWPSGWTNAQSALDYLVNTAGWTIN